MLSSAKNLNSDLDYVRGRHSFRTGLEFSGTRYTFLQPTSVSGVRRTTINLGLSF